MSVHARGTIRFLEGAALEDMLRKTSLHFEAYDRDAPSYRNIIAQLSKKGENSRKVAAEMEKRFKQVFPESK